MNLQTLPPTLREIYRYITFEIISKNEVSFAEVTDNAWKAVLGLFGEAGAPEINPWVPMTLYDPKKKRGIIRSNHAGVEKLRAALASIRDINGEPCVFVVLGVTGTIRSAKDKFFMDGQKRLADKV